MTTGDIIKKYRKALRMTQEELADRLGLTQSAIGKYESGQRTLSFQTIYEMQDIFGGRFLNEVMGFSDAEAKHGIFASICSFLGYSINDVVINENGEIIEKKIDEEGIFYPALKISHERAEREYLIKNKDAQNFMDKIMKHVEVDFHMLLEGADNGKAKENNR